MHMVSKRDLNSEELETVRTSRNPTTVMTANGEVQKREEATENVKDLDSFVTVMLLEETPAVLSLEKLYKDHGYTYHWISGQKPHLTKRAKELIAICQTMCHSKSLVYQRVPLRCPYLLRHHLHHKIPYLMSTDAPKIQYQKEVEVRVKSYGETRCINQQKPKTKLQMKDAKKYKAIYCITCRTGCRISEKFWSMNVILQNHGETLRLRIKILPILLMNYQRSREQKWKWVRVSTVSTRTFRRTPIAISA